MILLKKNFTVAHYWVTEVVFEREGLRMPDPDGKKLKPGSGKLTGLVEMTKDCVYG